MHLAYTGNGYLCVLVKAAFIFTGFDDHTVYQKIFQ
jgi:hypothetical protein